jgi:urea carboxylase
MQARQRMAMDRMLAAEAASLAELAEAAAAAGRQGSLASGGLTAAEEDEEAAFERPGLLKVRVRGWVET